MADESGEIILKTQDDSEADEATSPTASSGADYGRYLTGSALVRNGIENKMEQQGLKIKS